MDGNKVEAISEIDVLCHCLAVSRQLSAISF